MAVSQIKVTLGADLGEGKFNTSASYGTDPVAAAVPVAAALAVLVADGASPTQAHVTTLNSAYTTLAAAISTANLTVQVDTAVITTSNGVKAAFQKALQAAKNLGIVTP